MILGLLTVPEANKKFNRSTVQVESGAKMKVPTLGRRSRSLTGKQTSTSLDPTSSGISTESGSSAGLEVSFDEWKVTTQPKIPKKPVRSRSLRSLFRSRPRSFSAKAEKNEMKDKSSTGRTFASHTRPIEAPAVTTTDESSIFGDYFPQYMEWTKVNPFHSTLHDITQQDSLSNGVESCNNTVSSISSLSNSETFSSPMDSEKFGRTNNQVLRSNHGSTAPRERTADEQYKIIQAVIQSRMREQARFADDASSISMTNSVIVKTARDEWLGACSVASDDAVASDSTSFGDETEAVDTSYGAGITEDVLLDTIVSDNALTFDNVTTGNETPSSTVVTRFTSDDTLFGSIAACDNAPPLSTGASIADETTFTQKSEHSQHSGVTSAFATQTSFTTQFSEDTNSPFSLLTNEQSTSTTSDSVESRQRHDWKRQSRRRSKRDGNLFVEVFEDIRSLAEGVITGEHEGYKECLCAHDKECFF